MAHLQPSPHALPHRLRSGRSLLLAACLLVLGGGCQQPQALHSERRRKPTVTQPEVRQLTLLTYNVLSDPTHARARVGALMEILKESEADVIALQEVAPWFVKLLRAQPWYLRYHRTPIRRADIVPGGLLILSRFPMERILLARLPGPQERLALLADLRINGKTFAVVTSHLETTPSAGRVRSRQLDRIFPLLQHAPSGVLLGDLSFGDDAKPETKHLDKGYKDLWSALRKKTPGYTWDADRNAMAKRGSGADEANRREDRILWRSEVWRPHTIRVVGTFPTTRKAPVLFPSDHFGLLGVIQH